MKARLAALLLAAACSNAPAEVAPPMHGRVVDPAGRPLAGVSVSLVEASGGGEPVLRPGAELPGSSESLATTSEGGEFELATAGRAGWRWMRVEAPGRAPLLRDDEWIAVPSSARGVVVVLPPPVALEALVLDARGAPAGGSSVTVACDSPFGSALVTRRAGADGRVRFDGLPATARARVIAEKSGALARAETPLPLAGTARVPLHLQATREIAGTLVTSDAEPKPVAGARLVELVVPARELAPWEEDGLPSAVAEDSYVASEHVTGADGSFRMNLGPDSRAVLLQPSFAVEVLGDGRHVARRREAMSVSVMDLAGKPVAGARVSLGPFPDGWRSGPKGEIVLPFVEGMMRVVTHSGAEITTAARAGAFRVPVPAPRSVAGTLRRPAEGAETEAQPLPGAAVRLALDERHQALTWSDDAGAFSVPLPRPSGRASVTTPSHATARPIDAGAGSAAWLVPPAATLRVRVRSGGSAVAGALVVVESEQSPRVPRALLTDASGMATASGVASEPLRVAVSATGFRSRTTTAVPSASVHEVELRPAARLRVRVLDGDGRPLEGAEVRARGDGLRDERPPEMTARAMGARMTRGGVRLSASGSDGFATLDGLPPGECVALHVSRPGLAPHESACERATIGEGASIEVRLARPASVRGRVLDADGAAIAGATVEARRDSSTVDAAADARDRFRRGFTPLRSATADGGGAFALGDLPAGRVELVAAADGFRPADPLPADLAAGADLELDLRLHRGASVSGTVLRADGAPAAGATVTVHPNLTRGGFARGPRAFQGPSTEAGDDGRFVLSGLPPGRDVSLQAASMGERSAVRAAVPDGEPVTLTLVAMGRIAGRVTGGEDLASAIDVRCSGAPDGEASATADADGSFTALGVPPATYSCVALAGDEAEGIVRGIVVVAGRDTPVTIPLGPRTRQDVLVRDEATGEPVAGARVRDGSQAGRETLTGVDGHALVSLAPGGSSRAARIDVAAEGYARAFLSLPDPRPAVLEVKLRAGISLRGVLRDADSQPVAGVEVRTDAGARAMTEADGRFELTLRRPGAVELSASRASGGSVETASASVEVPPQGLDGAELRFTRDATGSLLVLVLDGDSPLPRAQVAVVHESVPLPGDALSALMPPVGGLGRSASGATDEEGTFAAEGLRAGRVTIFVARPDESTLREAGSAAVAAGQETPATVRVPAGSLLRGRVARGGVPVEGAMLSATPWTSAGWQRGEAPLALGRSGVGGAFELGPLPATIRRVFVRAEPPDGLAGSRGAVVEAVPGGPEAVLDLSGTSLTGEVRRGGEPVAGARVQALSAGSMSSSDTHSLPDGSFVLDGLEPSARHDVTATDGQGAPAAIVETTPAAGSLSIGVLDLGPAAELTGTAIGASGIVPPGLQLTLIRPGGARLPSSNVLLGPDGSWSVPAPAGERLQFRAAARGECPVLGEAQAGEPLAIAFPVGAHVTIAVASADGRPAPGAVARLVSWEGRPADERLVESRVPQREIEPGTIDCGPLMPGTSTLLVSRNGHETTLTVTLADAERRAMGVTLGD